MSDEIKATIQLNKLILCCTSTVEDNFNQAIISYRAMVIEPFHSFGKTKLIRDIDDSRRYKYSYRLEYADYYVDRINFCIFGQPHRNGKM